MKSGSISKYVRMQTIAGLFVLMLCIPSGILAQGVVFDDVAYANAEQFEGDELGFSGTLPAKRTRRMYCPPPQNQKGMSCVGWSAAYGVMSTMYNAYFSITEQAMKVAFAQDPYFIHAAMQANASGNCSDRVSLSSALEVLKETGCKKRMAQPILYCNSTLDSVAALRGAPFRLKGAYSWKSYVENATDEELLVSLKEFVSTKAPLLVGLYTTPSFHRLEANGLWVPGNSKDNKDSLNPHALCLIGYDDNKFGGAFELLNSYGKGYGDQGFVWIRYSDFMVYFRQIYQLHLYKLSSGSCRMGDCNNGYGHLWDSDNNRYEGTFLDGKKDGYGISCTKSGKTFVGSWKNNNKNGTGYLYLPETDKWYLATYENGKQLEAVPLGFGVSTEQPPPGLSAVFESLQQEGVVQLGDPEELEPELPDQTPEVRTTEPKPKDNRFVKEVFVNLVKAIGNYSIDEPKLEIDPTGTTKMAFYLPSEKTIFLDQKAIEICRAFGKDSSNAVAFLLGHELTHHYMQHIWIDRKMKSEFKGFSFMDNIRSFHKDSIRRLEMESQADIKGGFYAHIAGYSALQTGPALLRKLYSGYNRSDKNRDYPSLKEREQMCQRQLDKLNRLNKVFDAASYAFLIGQYRAAQEGFQHILDKGFNSREIYNNAGLAYLFEALELLEKDAEFAYPFELDAETRLLESSSRGSIGLDNREQIIELIEQGIKKFSRALTLDSDYHTAKINLGCAYSLLAVVDEENKLSQLNKAKAKLLECEENHTKTLILKGIIASQEGNKKAAKKYFTSAEKQGSALAALNKSIASGKEQENTAVQNSSVREKLNSSFKPEEYLFGFRFFEQPYEEFDLGNYTLFVKEMEQTRAYFFRSRAGDFMIELTKGEGHKSLQGIAVDAPVKELDVYGKPVVVSGTLGEYYHFKQNRVVFFEEGGRVKRWLVYHTK